MPAAREVPVVGAAANLRAEIKQQHAVEPRRHTSSGFRGQREAQRRAGAWGRDGSRAQTGSLRHPALDTGSGSRHSESRSRLMDQGVRTRAPFPGAGAGLRSPRRDSPLFDFCLVLRSRIQRSRRAASQNIRSALGVPESPRRRGRRRGTCFTVCIRVSDPDQRRPRSTSAPEDALRQGPA